MKDPEAKKKQWLQFRRQASNGFVGLPNRLVDSKAFADLTTGAVLQTLVWFWQMAEYPKGKRKPGAESVIGRIDKIENNGDLSFTFQEAGWRRMKQGRFSRALKELHRLGFIDVSHLGRGIRGDYTRFAISTRWQRYDTDAWEEIPYPENFHEGFGFRSTEYKKKRREQQRKINNVQKCTLPTSNNARYEGDEIPYNVQKRTLKTTPATKSQRAKTNVSIDLAMPLKTSTLTRKVKKKVRTRGHDSKSIAAASKTKIHRPLPFVKPKILECQLTPEQMDDFLREVENVRSWT